MKLFWKVSIASGLAFGLAACALDGDASEQTNEQEQSIGMEASALARMIYEGDYPTAAACRAAAPVGWPSECRRNISRGVWELWTAE